MPLPRLLSVPAALRRPAVLVPVTAVALAGLLAGGLLVANAVVAPADAPATAPVSATASPQAEAPAAADAGPTPGPASGPAPGPASGAASTTTSGGDDNVAVAVNTRDGSTVYALRLKVVITGADVVDPGNAAVAAAGCSDCQTVAVALEGVLVTGDAEVVAPVNLALAVNTECSNCQTLAYAYQHLQTFDGRVRLTGQGRRTIAQLRRELSSLRTSGLDVLAVKAEVDRIAGEFAAVLRDEVVPVGGPPSPATPTAGPDQVTPAVSPTAEPTTSPAQEPSTIEDPATPTETATPVPSTTATPSAG